MAHAYVAEDATVRQSQKTFERAIAKARAALKKRGRLQVDDDHNDSLWLDPTDFEPRPLAPHSRQRRVNNESGRGYVSGHTSDERRR